MVKTVTLIEGDGIGPEIIQAAQRVIEASGAAVKWEVCEAGSKVFRKGLATGLPKETIDSLKRTKVALKGPLETPVGHGEKSANVTLRTLFKTYANVRPVQNIPGIQTPYSNKKIDFVVIRENIEDLYGGIEYHLTPFVAVALKLISRMGSEKIIRFAFEFARSEGRRKVHCATKANILKLTEGLFKRTFEEISKEYPDIEAHHIIIDNCAHQMVLHPESFDVIVTTNLQGDIISDLGSGLVGGLGVAPAGNMGDDVAIFEAVHGSAPDIAGKNIVNPTAILFTSVMMLRYLKEFEAAHHIEQSLLYTLGMEKTFTKDLDKASTLTTQEFTDIIIQNLGKETTFWPLRPYKPLHVSTTKDSKEAIPRKSRGVDVYLESPLSSEALGKSLEVITLPSPFCLKLICNRGTQVYPETEGISSENIDLWRARFFLKDETSTFNDNDILELLNKIGRSHKWTFVVKLADYPSSPGFTKAQGES